MESFEIFFVKSISEESAEIFPITTMCWEIAPSCA